MERTEMQKLTMEPIKVMLGNEEYDIKPLVSKMAIPWVAKVVKILSESIGLTRLKSEDTIALESAMRSVMIDNPGKMIDLFFEYARDLNREEIENTASSAQLIAAFEQCLELEKPFLMGMARLRAISR